MRFPWQKQESESLKILAKNEITKRQIKGNENKRLENGKILRTLMWAIILIMVLFSVTVSNVLKSIALEYDEVSLTLNVNEIWNKWTKISGYENGSMKFPGNWSLNEAGGYIVNAENTDNMTGFYNPTANYSDIDISFDMGSWNGDDDTLGCFIRFSEDANHNCTGYIFMMANNTGGGGYPSPSTYGTGLYKIEGKQLFFENLTRLQKINHIWNRGQYNTVRLVAKGSNIQVYVRGELVININDTSIEKGSYGFFSISQPYAQFTNIRGTARLAHYFVNFDPNGEGASVVGDSTKEIISQKPYGEMPSAKRNGYTFDGWFTDRIGGTQIYPDTIVEVSRDQTLYAHWTPIQYEVRYNGNGHTGGTMTNSTHIFDQRKNLNQNNYVKEHTLTYNYNGNGQENKTVQANATFAGWAPHPKDDVEYSDMQEVLNLRNTEGIYDVYAKWTLKNIKLESPTRKGFNFLGWSENSGATTPEYPDGSSLDVDKNTTLYAIWDPYSLKLRVSIKDSETENIVKSNSTVDLYEWNKTTGTYTKKATLEKASDGTYQSNGYLKYSDENEGKFRIVETLAPDGYYGDWTDGTKTNKNVYEFNIQTIVDSGTYNGTQVSDKGTIDIVIENDRVKGTINISKIDSETNRYMAQGSAILEGATYGFYANEDIYHKDTVKGLLYKKDQIVDLKEVVNGTFILDDIEIGNYYLKEIKAPEGYTLDPNKYVVSITYQGEQVPHINISANVKDKVIKQAISIKKLSVNSQSQQGTPLEGAGFKVYFIKDLAGVKNGNILPDANGKYKAEDFYDYDFSSENTALDYSSNQEGERIAEFFTNKLGEALSPELAYGQYVIVESTVPKDRYKVNPFVVEIKEDSRTPQNFRYLEDEEFEALIKVNKYDSSTDKLVLNNNALYRIWSITEQKYIEQEMFYPTRIVVGTEENPYRINKDGSFITPLNLLIGEYELREIEAPKGYVKQGYEGTIKNGVKTNNAKPVVRFSVAMNTAYLQDEETNNLIINVNQYNDPMVGELKIEKQGEFLVGTSKREDGTIDFEYELRKVEGTSFDVYAKEKIYTQDNQETLIYEKDALVGTITTNTEGIGYLDNLPIGKYYIKETEAGEGFTLNKEIKEFEVKYQGEETPVQEIEVDYTNERQKAEVNDNRGLIIEKVTEKIVYKPGEEVTYIIKVSNTGDVEAKNIKVTETKINGVFDDIENENIEKVDDKTIIIKSLKPGESIELTYKTTLKSLDEIDAKIEVTNVVDAKGEVTVPDPENPGGTKDEDIEAEDKKDIVVTDKDLVVYKEALKESYAPGEVAQYLIHVINNGTEKIKNINVSETMLNGRFVELEESEVNGIKITYKKTEEGEDDLNNVIIDEINPKEEVTLKYEYLIPLETEYDTKVGNDIKVKGTILIPNPDDPDNPTEKEVEDEDSEEITIKEDDNMLGIVKTDSKTGERVAGAVIGIYAKEDIKISDGRILIEKGTLIEKVVTDEQGKGKFTVDLPLGMYYVQEIEAPKGYLLSTEQIDVDLRYKGQDQETITISHIISDRRREIRVDKLDEEGKLLVGAELEIVDENGEVFAKWTTGEEGQIIDKLEKEKVYTLRETSPAKGYTTAKEIKFYIGEDEKLYQKEEGLTNGIEVDYLVMKDTKTKIKIEVKDKETGENVPGIKVDIVDKTTGEVVDTVVTTEDGAEIEGLPIGDYELRIQDPENRGYVTDSEDITVKDTPEEQKYEIDADYTKVEIGIKDEETDKLLPGGKIEVLDEEGNVVAEIETEEDMSKLDRLPPGKYTLHQTEAPRGYWPSEDVEIEVKDTGEKQTFTLTNRRKIFDMSVEKKLIKQVYNGVVTDITGNLSKFEIRPQNIGKAEFWTIYTVTVKNVGEIEGKATVKELVPDGFEMYQESNLAWKVEGNEATLTTDVIEPGKSLQYEVALRWKQSVLNIGMKENKVSLVSTENEFGFKDENEDGNNSSASILVALSTGLETHTEIVICIMLVVAILGIISIIIFKVHLNKKMTEK